MNKKEVKATVAAVRQFVDAMDTPKEVRASVGYLFLIGVSDRLVELGMAGDLSVRVAARINVSLPNDFQQKFPDEFAELIRLYAKQTFVLWKTCVADFDDAIYEEVFLELASTSSIG